ncbi:MAG TPA: hypothetical protein VG742_10775 [Dongiaceae bacterium]|nr:hypothetical protein [Dongiaceae bacterium]
MFRSRPSCFVCRSRGPTDSPNDPLFRARRRRDSARVLPRRASLAALTAIYSRLYIFYDLHLGGRNMEQSRTDWRVASLLPAAAFGLVLFLGFLAWNNYILQATPAFGRPELAGLVQARAVLGAFIAGKHAIVAATFLLFLASAMLVLLSGWTVFSIYREVTDKDSTTYMQRTDEQASFILVACMIGLVALPAIQAFLGNAQCGAYHLYECLGKEIMPDLLVSYAGRLFVKAAIDPVATLSMAADWGNAAVGLAGIALLAAMVMLPRGLEQGLPPAKHAEETAKATAAGTTVDYKELTVGELKAWFNRRVRRFEQLSFITSLVLVAGIAQMSVWMKWPLSIIADHVFLGDNAVSAELHANYEAHVDSVLQYSAIWYGAMVAMLIFTTRLILSRKCRQLAGELIADPATTQPDKDTAQALIDETFSATSAQVYFERYRTYLLALAPAIAQQLLEVFGS